MAWTAPRTWSTSEIVTAANMNTHVRDNLLHLGQIAYVEFTSAKQATSTSEASAVTVVSAGAYTFDGTSKFIIEFFCPRLSSSDNSNGVVLTLFDGNTSTPVGQLVNVLGDNSGANAGHPCYVQRQLTPTAGSHTYFVGINDNGAVTATSAIAAAGSGGTGALLPGFIRIRGAGA